jgi:hypothetical protein
MAFLRRSARLVGGRMAPDATNPAWLSMPFGGTTTPARRKPATGRAKDKSEQELAAEQNAKILAEVRAQWNQQRADFSLARAPKATRRSKQARSSSTGRKQDKAKTAGNKTAKRTVKSNPSKLVLRQRIMTRRLLAQSGIAGRAMRRRFPFAASCVANHDSRSPR